MVLGAAEPKAALTGTGTGTGTGSAERPRNWPRLGSVVENVGP